MSKKNIVKIILDVIMTGMLVLLYNSHVFTMIFHEIAGLILAGLFIVHCFFNKKWIASITPKLFNRDLSTRVKIGYIVNALLLVSFAFVIISGIKTSQVLFPAAVETKDSIWRCIHHFSSATALLLVGIHIGLHWGFIMNMCKKVFKITTQFAKPLCNIALIVILVFGSYSIATGSFASWLTEPFIGGGVSHGMHGMKSNGDSAILSTLTTYLSIMGVFSIFTYYIDEWAKSKA